ncbi:ABC transporter substrate-binding protein [Sulfitobacter sp. F26204]|uniref:heme/hemin ABC transporter substrate-binding protein n=1 Tax=Sulfitobacter sp. F26204 TaxID=2996014 RepID=UPI00225E181E|nr:ABC transporter substrate-binding protein [Sulfitobacter sp. F26204]MCX7559535.1 ABC transporter substrate-binding protein [Sulfitobacter sp. F26204]
MRSLTLVAAFCLISTSLPALAQSKPGGIVSIGGSVTEIIFALGAADRLVARDTTSSYPPEAESLPDVGYMRALSPEGVLATDPTMIIAEDGAGPLETISVLEGAHIPFVTVPDEFSAQGVSAKIMAIGKAINEEEKAEALAADLRRRLNTVMQTSQGKVDGEKRRVLFVLSTQGGRIMASGTNTAAAAMIEMAGARNAVTVFEGYKPLTDEAVIAAAPDAILMMERAGDHDGSIDGLLSLPAIASTPAAQNRAVIRMDGLYLLGFGPRTADAVSDLNRALYGS